MRDHDKSTEPTEEGLARYPPDGYYSDDDERWPCVCEPACAAPCRGACGCPACNASYQDFLSTDW